MKILVITAHPDDVDFGAGGTVAAWVAEGNLDAVRFLIENGASLDHRDARGNNALDDAVREKRT